ncbi:MAG: hypothetical protein H0T89_19195 [Deltaproteobacteria bacterium]|nr:hypothetical protein [Deltaproteobacteria bacterium]MDQ3296708.1 hypothetical protein [Myxococcota bacterium]
MSTTSNDIPSLTLRVLENIQGELVGLRGDVQVLSDRFQGLNDRFDHFLGFVGRDVQDLKVRVAALEQHNLPRQP